MNECNDQTLQNSAGKNYRLETFKIH